MDGFLASDLPWQLKMLALLTAGLVLAVGILGIPERAIVYLGRRYPWWSPSVTTGFRAAIFWPGLLIVYQYLSVFVGFLGIVLSCILDVFDGRQSRVYAKHGIPRTEKEMAFGQFFDQICDKGTVPPSLVYFGYLGATDTLLAWGILGVDVVGAAMRHVRGLGTWIYRHVKTKETKRFGMRIRALHKAITRSEKATSVGKIKALMQCFCLIACLPYHQGWINDGRWVTNVMMAFTLTLGVLSIFSRLRVHETVDSTVDWITAKFFSHMDLRATLRSLIYSN